MTPSVLHESIIANSQFTFARSGGKGGQNVNKVNTKVHLVLPLASIAGITDEERIRLRAKLSSIINGDDCLFLDVDDERFQEVNRKIALARMNALKVQKKRKKTHPTKASREKRLKLKKIKSEIKKNRRLIS